MSSSDDHAELLRQFNAAVAGQELADLHQVGVDPGPFGFGAPPPPRPDLRHPRRAESALFRVRIEVEHAHPVIWRTVDIRQDTRLSLVHQVIQVAFGWEDRHLHRFSLGGGAFDRTSQLFLCPYDVEEGEDNGLPDRSVRLDETLKVPGDRLHYVYDYGDNWGLVLELEEVRTVTPTTPVARVVDGRWPSPPEDAGGIGSLTHMPQAAPEIVIDDINAGFDARFYRLHAARVDEWLIEIIARLQDSPVADDVNTRVETLLAEPIQLGPEDLEASLRPILWLLDRASEGLELTSSGYLRPTEVAAISKVIPEMGASPVAAGREANTPQVLAFRELMQELGLIRKYTGRLVLSRLGRTLGQDPQRLWAHLVQHLAPSGETFEIELHLLVLFHAATTGDEQIHLADLVAALTELEWRHQDRSPLQTFELLPIPALVLLGTLAGRRWQKGEFQPITALAATLARAVLRLPDPDQP